MNQRSQGGLPRSLAERKLAAMRDKIKNPETKAQGLEEEALRSNSYGDLSN